MRTDKDVIKNFKKCCTHKVEAIVQANYKYKL